VVEVRRPMHSKVNGATEGDTLGRKSISTMTIAEVVMHFLVWFL